MGELIARILNDYLDHVIKDCKYDKGISITWNTDNSRYDVYYSQPNAGTEIYFNSSAEESLIKLVMVTVAVMKTFKEARRKEMDEKATKNG